MGTYYTSYALIGVKIPIDHLYERVQEPQCKHEIPEGANNCPTCGKKVGMVTNVYAKRVMGLLELIQSQSDPGFIWADRTEDEKPCIYYGFGVTSHRDSGEGKHTRTPDLGMIAPLVRARLETYPLSEFKLWSPEVERSFGFYSLTIGH